MRQAAPEALPQKQVIGSDAAHWVVTMQSYSAWHRFVSAAPVVMWPLAPAVAAVARGSFKARNPPAIKGTGYVVASLEAALWALHRSQSFEEGCLLAVNLGDDADTTAAVYGQLAGALYGESGIPARWRQLLAMRVTIEGFADRLCARARDRSPAS